MNTYRDRLMEVRKGDMSSISGIENALRLKTLLVEKGGSELRKNLIDNLKNLIKNQISEIDKKYSILGLDTRLFSGGEFFMHDLKERISKIDEMSGEKKSSLAEMIGSGGSSDLIAKFGLYLKILCYELDSLCMGNLADFKQFLGEEGKIVQSLSRDSKNLKAR